MLSVEIGSSIALKVSSKYGMYESIYDPNHSHAICVRYEG